MWKLLLGPVLSVVENYQTNKARKKELEEVRHLKVLEGIQSAEASEFIADSERSKGLVGSWKDEYITILVSIPLVLCFIPGYDVYVISGFKALEGTPQWYQWILFGVLTVGAGVPLAGKTVNTIQSVLDKK